ncbi:MAG: NUDIX domain-containing protein [Parcubacteria group bacterium]|jgi:isopentenyldiphosphate isomerase
MNDELLDIVDENNILTGESALRSKIHSQGIWHRTVHIYFFRVNKGKIELLIHLRSKFKDSAPNTWDTRFGGHIKAGSTIEEGVRTELREEIGLNIDMQNLLEGDWQMNEKMPNREFSKMYFFKYDGDLVDLKFNDGEVQEIKWMSIEDIKSSMDNNPKGWCGVSAISRVSDYLINKD